jgi:dienelactone hydrolase
MEQPAPRRPLEDTLLPPEQSALMHEALQTVGARSEVEWIEGADHVFFGVDPDPIAGRSAERSPMQGSRRWR